MLWICSGVSTYLVVVVMDLYTKTSTTRSRPRSCWSCCGELVQYLYGDGVPIAVAEVSTPNTHAVQVYVVLTHCL